MAGFKVEVQHGLGQTRAVDKLQSFSRLIEETYQAEVTEVQQEWRDDGTLHFSFKAMGLKIAGNALVEETRVAVQGSLPLAAVMFRGAIEKEIRAKLEQALRV